MNDISRLLKCPNCRRVGMMTLRVDIKTAYAECRACDHVEDCRVPYPKHRRDNEGRQLRFYIPSIRSIEAGGGPE